MSHELLSLKKAAVALVAFVHNAVQGQVAPKGLGVGHLRAAYLADVGKFWVYTLDVVTTRPGLDEEQATVLALVLVALGLHVFHKSGKQAKPAVTHSAPVVTWLRAVVLLLHSHVLVGMLGTEEMVLKVIIVIKDHVAHGAVAVRLLVVAQ